MCAHMNRHALRPGQPADGAVGTRSHLQQLAGVINDVALNFGDHHFWELLFILYWSIMGALEGERARDRPLSAILKGGETPPPSRLANGTFHSN